MYAYLSFFPEDCSASFSSKSWVSEQRGSEKSFWEGLSILLVLCWLSHTSEGKTVISNYFSNHGKKQLSLGTLHPARRMVTSSTNNVIA